MNFDPNTGQPLNQNVQQTTGDSVNQMNTEQHKIIFRKLFKMKIKRNKKKCVK